MNTAHASKFLANSATTVILRTLHRLMTASVGLRRWTIAAFQLALAACCTISQAQQHPEDITLATMCRNGLADSAVRYADAQRAIVSDDASRYAKWTMRLMECFAQSALRGSPDAWEQCASTYEAFKTSRPDDARLPWLAWQLARCDLLRAQSNVARYLAVPALSQMRDDALVIIRRIEQQIELLEDDIKRRLPLAARQSVSGGREAPAEQLAKLSVDAGLLRCEALLIRARLYAAGSRDRIAAATDVESQAADILKRTGNEWPSRDALQIAIATAELELGKSAEAIVSLTQLARQASASNVRSRAALTAIEYLAATGQVSSARKLLPLLGEEGYGAETEIARLQIAIAELSTENSDERDAQLASLVEQAKRLGAEYGDYWRNRGEALLTGSVSTDAVSDNARIALDLMIVEVRQLLAAGDEPEAVRKLLQFRDNEAVTGRGETAIQLASMASALLQRQEQWLAAADALATVSLDFPDVEQASEAHVRVIYALSQALRANAGNTAIAERYEAALLKQLATWPDSESSDQPQVWLGRWLAGQRRTAEFAKALASRAARCQDAAVATRVLFDWFVAVTSLTEAPLRLQIVSDLKQRIEADDFENVKLTAEIIQLTAFAHTAWPTQQESQQVTASARQLEASTSQSDERMLLTSVQLLHALRNGKTADPTELQRWSPSRLSPELRHSLVGALVEAVGELPIESQSRWARQLKFDAPWATELIGSDDLWSQAAGYRMLLWTGEVESAVSGLRVLAKSQTRNGLLQLQLAAALADSGSSGLAESTSIARRLAASSSPASELYIASRWRLVRNYLFSGDTQQAKSAAELVLASQPIESEVWRERFEEIARL